MESQNDEPAFAKASAGRCRIMKGGGPEFLPQIDTDSIGEHLCESVATSAARSWASFDWVSDLLAQRETFSTVALNSRLGRLSSVNSSKATSNRSRRQPSGRRAWAATSQRPLSTSSRSSMVTYLRNTSEVERAARLFPSGEKKKPASPHGACRLL